MGQAAPVGFAGRPSRLDVEVFERLDPFGPVEGRALDIIVLSNTLSLCWSGLVSEMPARRSVERGWRGASTRLKANFEKLKASRPNGNKLRLTDQEPVMDLYLYTPRLLPPRPDHHRRGRCRSRITLGRTVALPSGLLFRKQHLR
jgi:hypothetical protein